MENEKRLISLDEALKATHSEIYWTESQQAAVRSFLVKQPKVDAVEVVHGHWCWEGRFKACSKCGSYVEWDETLGANFWKFCPYCGAKMDGDGNG